MGYNFYVVNARNSRGNVTSRGTHIMRSKSSSTPGVGSAVIVGGLLGFGSGTKQTLCGQWAGRHVEVFQPSEVICRECKRRWQLLTQTSQPAPTVKSAKASSSNSGRSQTSSSPPSVGSKPTAQSSKAEAPSPSVEVMGAIAIWVVAANIPPGDVDRYIAGWFDLTEDDRQQYRRMARACITATERAKKSE
jgi:hypothetical protein